MDGSAAPRKLTVSDFVDWAEASGDGRRYELLDGEIVAQSSPLRRHSRTLGNIFSELRAALPPACEVLIGCGVGIDEHTALEPDAVVFCGERPGDETRYEGAPVIVVEVLSPSTSHLDLGRKGEAYRRLASLQHYLVINPVERFVLIHSRGPEDNWGIVRVAREDFTLDPPGVHLSFDTIFGRLGDA